MKTRKSTFTLENSAPFLDSRETVEALYSSMTVQASPPQTASELNQLALNYRLGKNGAKKNILMAIKYYELAASQNDMTAMLALGEIYQKKDPRQAIDWYVKTCLAGEREYSYHRSQLSYDVSVYNKGIRAKCALEKMANNGDEYAHAQLADLEKSLPGLFNRHAFEVENDIKRINVAVQICSSPYWEKNKLLRPAFDTIKEILTSHTATYIKLDRIKALKKLPQPAQECCQALTDRLGKYELKLMLEDITLAHLIDTMSDETLHDPDFFNALLNYALEKRYYSKRIENQRVYYYLATMYETGLGGKREAQPALAAFFYFHSIIESQQSNLLTHHTSMRLNPDYHRQQAFNQNALLSLQNLQQQGCGDAAYYLSQHYSHYYNVKAPYAAENTRQALEKALELNSPLALSQSYKECLKTKQYQMASARKETLKQLSSNDAVAEYEFNNLHKKHYSLSSDEMKQKLKRSGFYAPAIDLKKVHEIVDRLGIGEKQSSNLNEFKKRMNEILLMKIEEDSKRHLLIIAAKKKGVYLPIDAKALNNALRNMDANAIDSLHKKVMDENYGKQALVKSEDKIVRKSNTTLFFNPVDKKEKRTKKEKDTTPTPPAYNGFAL